MAIEFKAPEFVMENDPDMIHAQMMKSLPSDIDNMPGGFPYDFTMPAAVVKSELIQFHLVNTLMLMFPEWAFGEWLDLHGKAVGIVRREAGFAAGNLTIEGTPGTKIIKGSVFATASVENRASIEFKAIASCTIPESGIGTVSVQAVEGGTESNVNPLTITLMSKPIPGIARVYNADDITGGTQEEDDESLRRRIAEVNSTGSYSFVGNDADYIRWAKEVTGVGTVLIESEWDGPGTVKVIVLDANGRPANESIIKAVYEYIVSPDDRLNRRAPIGAGVTVIAPETKPLSYYCRITLDPQYSADYIRSQYEEALNDYYSGVKKDGFIRYSNTLALLALMPGVIDVDEFQVNGKKSNLKVLKGEYPVTESIVIEVEE